MDLEAELDRLYSVPLDEFTDERNSIAKTAGGDDAKRVKQLKKPSVAAWAMNQLVRKHPKDVEELPSVRDELEHAGSPKELRAMSDRRRELVESLTKFTKSVLAEASSGAATTTRATCAAG